MRVWHYELNMPLGPMWAAFDESGRLWELAFGGLDPRATMPLAPKAQREVHRYLLRQLDAYFAGTLHTFTVPLHPQGKDFHKRVWEELVTIPFGRPLALHDLVARFHGDVSQFEVETALQANPIAIVIPGHRVLGADGSIPGYAMTHDLQKSLLIHEGAWKD